MIYGDHYTPGPRGPGIQCRFKCRTFAPRANTTLRFQLARERAWIGPLIIWNLNIAPIFGPDQSESAYSLLRPDGSLRPAYRQVRSAGE